jgi:hypothetical protein
MTTPTPIRTLLLTFTPSFDAPPIALIATHRQGFPTAQEALRVFLECIADMTNNEAPASILSACTILAGAPPQALGKWASQLSDLGWELGTWSPSVAHVSGLDRLLQPDAPGFTLLPLAPAQPTPAITTFAAGASVPLTLGDLRPSKLSAEG